MRLSPRLTTLAVAILLAIPLAASAQAPAAVTVTEEKPGLLKQAKIQPAQAQATAIAQAPKGTITKAEIEKEGGKLVYSFDITVPGASGVTEVLVDAMTGKVVSTEHEAAEAAPPAKRP